MTELKQKPWTPVEQQLVMTHLSAANENKLTQPAKFSGNFKYWYAGVIGGFWVAVAVIYHADSLWELIQ